MLRLGYCVILGLSAHLRHEMVKEAVMSSSQCTPSPCVPPKQWKMTNLTKVFGDNTRQGTEAVIYVLHVIVVPAGPAKG